MLFRSVTQPILDLNGNIIHYQGVILNISEIILAEQAVKDEIQRFQLLFNYANDAIFMHPLNSKTSLGNFIDVNEIACKRLGYTKEELLQLSPADIGIDEKDRIFEIINKIIADGSAVFETVHISKQGEKIPVEVNTFLVELKGKEIGRAHV